MIFHIKTADGIWFCFSTRQSGGAIELIQKLEGLNCFDTGCAPEPEGVQLSGEKKKQANETDPPASASIKQSLLPSLSGQGSHEEFIRRGIGEKTCHYLGCGLLDKGRSQLKNRIVFQVRGIEQTGDSLESVILTHIGRATTPEQLKAGGKWLTYKGFRKSAELYNIDKLLLGPVARDQVRRSGHVLIVEGAFDVAMLVEAGLFNVIAVMGSDLCDEAKPRLDLIREELNAPDLRLWFDRDQAGASTIEKLQSWGMAASGFDWSTRFGANQIGIPEDLNDPCDMNIQQIQWLRRQVLI